jgi:hypothetical protein
MLHSRSRDPRARGLRSVTERRRDAELGSAGAADAVVEPADLGPVYDDLAAKQAADVVQFLVSITGRYRIPRLGPFAAVRRAAARDSGSKCRITPHTCARPGPAIGAHPVRHRSVATYRSGLGQRFVLDEIVIVVRRQCTSVRLGVVGPLVCAKRVGESAVGQRESVGGSCLLGHRVRRRHHMIKPASAGCLHIVIPLLEHRDGGGLFKDRQWHGWRWPGSPGREVHARWSTIRRADARGQCHRRDYRRHSHPPPA